MISRHASKKWLRPSQSVARPVQHASLLTSTPHLKQPKRLWMCLTQPNSKAQRVRIWKMLRNILWRSIKMQCEMPTMNGATACRVRCRRTVSRGQIKKWGWSIDQLPTGKELQTVLVRQGLSEGDPNLECNRFVFDFCLVVLVPVVAGHKA